jgi:membrane-associated protein
VTGPLAVNILSASSVVSTFGTIGLIAIVFAETGLLIGFFLPGDSLLFLAGAYCATKAGGSEPHLNLATVLIGVIVAAIVGAQTGYFIGRKAGPVLFDRPNSRIFKRQNVEKAHEVLRKYGETRAIIFARFIPVVRTFMNPVVGTIDTDVRTFTVANVVGGVMWAAGVTLLGYALGGAVHIDHYIIPVTAVIVVLSAIPVLLEVRKQRRESAEPATHPASGPAPSGSAPSGPAPSGPAPSGPARSGLAPPGPPPTSGPGASGRHSARQAGRR